MKNLKDMTPEQILDRIMYTQYPMVEILERGLLRAELIRRLNQGDQNV